MYGDPADESSVGIGLRLVGGAALVPTGARALGVDGEVACRESLDPADAVPLGIDPALVGGVALGALAEICRSAVECFWTVAE